MLLIKTAMTVKAKAASMVVINKRLRSQIGPLVPSKVFSTASKSYLAWSKMKI